MGSDASPPLSVFFRIRSGPNGLSGLTKTQIGEIEMSSYVRRLRGGTEVRVSGQKAETLCAISALVSDACDQKQEDLLKASDELREKVVKAAKDQMEIRVDHNEGYYLFLHLLPLRHNHGDMDVSFEDALERYETDVRRFGLFSCGLGDLKGAEHKPIHDLIKSQQRDLARYLAELIGEQNDEISKAGVEFRANPAKKRKSKTAISKMATSIVQSTFFSDGNTLFNTKRFSDMIAFFKAHRKSRQLHVELFRKRENVAKVMHDVMREAEQRVLLDDDSAKVQAEIAKLLEKRLKAL